MNKYEKHYEQRQDTFYLEAGRVICRNSKALFAIKLLEHDTGPRYNILPVKEVKESIKKALVNHDGYNPNIIIK